MNRQQQARLANLNDSYGVARWEEQGSTVWVECENGDEAEIYSDGTVNWKSLPQRTSPPLP